MWGTSPNFCVCVCVWGELGLETEVDEAEFCARQSQGLVRRGNKKCLRVQQSRCGEGGEGGVPWGKVYRDAVLFLGLFVGA